jgi:hypothetical protein
VPGSFDEAFFPALGTSRVDPPGEREDNRSDERCRRSPCRNTDKERSEPTNIALKNCTQRDDDQARHDGADEGREDVKDRAGEHQAGRHQPCDEEDAHEDEHIEADGGAGLERIDEVADDEGDGSAPRRVETQEPDIDDQRQHEIGREVFEGKNSIDKRLDKGESDSEPDEGEVSHRHLDSEDTASITALSSRRSFWDPVFIEVDPGCGGMNEDLFEAREVDSGGDLSFLIEAEVSSSD